MFKKNIGLLIPLVRLASVDPWRSFFVPRAAAAAEPKVNADTEEHNLGSGNVVESNWDEVIDNFDNMELREELKEFVLNGASAVELKREAIRGGMLTLRRSALHKLSEGVTTLSEVYRVSSAD